MWSRSNDAVAGVVEGDASWLGDEPLHLFGTMGVTGSGIAAIVVSESLLTDR